MSFARFCTCLILFAAFSCKGKQLRQTHVTVELQNAYNQTVYLESIEEAGTENRTLDSAFIKDRVQTVKFEIEDKQESLYRLRTSDSRIVVPFVSDTRSIKINLDYFEPAAFSFQNSPASSTLNNFGQWLLEQANYLRDNPDSIPNIDSVRVAFFQHQQQHYRNFVDTVSSPAVALYYFNNVEYGMKYDSLVLLMNRLHARFAGYTAWERLYEDTKVYEQIMTKELQVGDRLPDFLVTNQSGAILPITFYKHGYLLLDIWSTWDYRSLKQSEYTKKANALYSHKNLSVVSIALDPEKAEWERTVALAGRTWPQMIDQKVWRGPAVQALNFDSIPFNFLVDPSGIIIAKALYGDSLLFTLDRTLSNVNGR